MKATIDIADELFERAKSTARHEGTTLRALVEAGLRSTLAERGKRAAYAWEDLSVGGEGLAPELEGKGWGAIRDLVHADRGA